MLVVDIMFILGLFLLMVPLGMWRQAAFAVMKRNFVGYFSSPTGYVFLCLFVLLTSFAAFWPHEFFTTNLANLDQLNMYLPYIMLIFIPAITMSIWAEERRQGTDELLLTLPARDFDIVIGKYFAAVLVFTVSLLFSHISNYAVLIAMTGGQLDSGLLFSTYLGYWWMGIAMLAIGMVASFLTNNLTVGFIFGAAFNAPLAFFSDADVILSNSKWINRLFEWSLLQRFEPFGRGLISLPSAIYFLGIVVIGIYLSLILIGRRHWLGGRDGTSMLSHYVLRALFLVATCVAVALIAQHSPLNKIRADVSANKISTLSPNTLSVLKELTSNTKDENGRDLPPINIDAYVSNNVPSEYAQTKQDLVNLLREFDVLGGKRIQLNLYNGISPFGEEALNAESKYGIQPVRVNSETRGAIKQEQVVLGVAFSSGRERVVSKFIPYGMPVEYELIRSINTVSQPKRKKIAIIRTDALVAGATIPFSNGQEMRVNRLRILGELIKQYDVELVDASQPINLFIEDDEGKPTERRYAAMVVIQPSKMTGVEMENMIKAIQTGQPTAIFEDPKLNVENFQHIPGTFYSRLINRGGSDGGDIQALWDALDLNMDRKQIPLQLPNPSDPNAPPITGEQFKQAFRVESSPYIVWQQGNPYPRDPRLDRLGYVILSQENSSDQFFDPEHPATRGINQLFLQYPGYLQPKRNSSLNLRELVVSDNAGRVQELLLTWYPRQAAGERGADNSNYTIAAEIKGNKELSDFPASVDDIKPDKQYTNVIYICDVDMIADYFVDIRDSPIRNNINYRFQNMSFVLNVIDALAGNDIYQEVRNRRERHVTLKAVENTTEEAMDKLHTATQELQIKFATAQEKLNQEKNARLADIDREITELKRRRDRREMIDAQRLQSLEQRRAAIELSENAKIQDEIGKLNNELREQTRFIQSTSELEIQKKQREFKLAAVVIPPIPPLVVGLIVFTRRRLREREGISKARRLK